MDLPSGIKMIDAYTLRGCTSLTGLTIPAGVTKIYEEAFGECTSLESITISAGVTAISEDAFNGCTALASVSVDDNNPRYRSVDEILYDRKEAALVFCPKAKEGSVSVPEGVKLIESHAFSACVFVTRVSLPNSLESIGFNAFVGCDLQASMIIPEGVKEIGPSAFCFCKDLRCITILASVTDIHSEAFLGCTAMVGIYVDENSQHFSSEDGLLYNKQQTQLISFPAGKIGSLNIPYGVMEIADRALDYCPELTSINVDDGNERFSSVDGILYSKDMTQLIRCPGAKTGEVTVPDGVKSIASYAFSGCTGLSALTLPYGIEGIGYAAFDGLTQFDNLPASESAEEIGN